MLILVFGEISCVQASVSLNPVRTFWVFLLQYDETTLKEDSLGCDVSASLVNMCSVCPVSSSAPGAVHAAWTQWL